ncbi:MAG TPA: amidohydrolase [Clostridiales bacterium]|nr:amidohydrolase [Clostridiales bacterium]
MIIDFHMHGFPDELAEKALATLSGRCGIPPSTDGTLTGIKASMKAAGISRGILLSIATRPSQNESILRWAASLRDDSLIAFGSLHPGHPDAVSQVQQAAQLGLKGIKFHPDYQDFYVDDKAVFPVYEKACREGLIMIFHAGVDIGLPGPVHCTPERMRRVVDAFPGARIIAAHMGGFQCWDEAEHCLVGTDVYMDTSFSIPWMQKDQFFRMISRHDPRKILFGTDTPWSSQAVEVEQFLSLDLAEEIKRGILCENAMELLA